MARVHALLQQGLTCEKAHGEGAWASLHCFGEPPANVKDAASTLELEAMMAAHKNMQDDCKEL